MRLLLLTLAMFSVLLTSGREDELEDDPRWVKKLHAPTLVDPRSDLVVLWCEYDLQGKDLLGVTWWKYDRQIFRYMPSLPTKGTSFPNESDVNVSLERSNGTHLVLRGHRNVQRNVETYGGTYYCEVMAEKSFKTDYAGANVSTAIVPRSKPVLEGVSANYQVGEQLDAICSSAPSLPAARLTFHLNNDEVTTANQEDLPIGESSISSRLTLSLTLNSQDFPNGQLNLSCRATLPGIYDDDDEDFRTEKLATLQTPSYPPSDNDPDTLINHSVVFKVHHLLLFPLILLVAAQIF